MEKRVFIEKRWCLELNLRSFFDIIIKNRMGDDVVKSWEELEIRDDYMFAEVMRDKKICKTLLEKLLHIKVKDLEYVEAQKR